MDALLKAPPAAQSLALFGREAVKQAEAGDRPRIQRTERQAEQTAPARSSRS